MSNLRILHIDLDSGRVVAKTSPITDSLSPIFDNRYLRLSGGDLTGQVNISIEPTTNTHITNKLYVDNTISSAISPLNDTLTQITDAWPTLITTNGGTIAQPLKITYTPSDNTDVVSVGYVNNLVNTTLLKRSGGTLTGHLTLVGDPVTGLQPATKSYVDTLLGYAEGSEGGAFLSKSGGTMTGPLVLSQDPPQDPNEAISKTYLEDTLQDGKYKQHVKAATTQEILLSGSQQIDGVTVLAGDRVLVKDQLNANLNGVYIVDDGIWTRAGDADPNIVGRVSPGMMIFVSEGESQQDTVWFLSTDDPIDFNTSDFTFIEVSTNSDVESVSINGDTMTGELVLYGNPVSDYAAVPKQYMEEEISKKNYIHTQDSLANVWSIQHNKNTTNFTITVIVDDTVVMPNDIKIIDTNTVEVHFADQFIGHASMSIY